MPELPQIRTLYQESVTSEHKARKLWTTLSRYKGKDAVMIAYKASARALLANHDWNPYHKLQYLKEAMEWFKLAVKGSPPNIEIRFLRFAVQHHMPAFLGLSAPIERDKQIILTNISHFSRFQLSHEEAHRIAEFVWTSGRCTKDEEISLKQLFLDGESPDSKTK
ncbi:MAG: hypothetical protein AAF824_02270 [Bacteroidota bacterium]